MPQISTFFQSDAEENEITKKLFNLKETRPTGLISIPNKIIKLSSATIAPTQLVFTMLASNKESIQMC